jgi:hypothetical protein
MSRHKVFRNPQGAKVYPIRDFLGSHMPSGSDGFVIEDLDWAVLAPEDAQLLIVRRFGERYGLDATGDFLIAEFKHRPDLLTYLDTAQQRTFGLLDEQCRLGDEMREQRREPRRYCGFYVVAYDQPQPGPETRWCVRRIGADKTKPMTWDEFSNWLQIVQLGQGAA